MARTWILDGRGIARKVKNARNNSSSSSSSSQSKEWQNGAVRECPNCKHRIDNSDVSVEWPGLPAGVKFDPSDSELMDHLAAKIGIGNSTAHPLIDEFIPTVQEDDGICYTHPENLPGIKKDGSSVHFFHRTSNAYSTGQRKRRKIQKQKNLPGERVRWHKTGRTRLVVENGVHKGCKKIMVLYKSAKKSKPDKTNWVMHQYHLGASEDEKDGELVVSKIFYQQQQQQFQMAEKTDLDRVGEDDAIQLAAGAWSEEPDVSDLLSSKVIPRTPMTYTPDPPKQRAIHSYDEGDEEHAQIISLKDASSPTRLQDSAIHLGEEIDPTWFAGESQIDGVPEHVDFDTSLLCNEDSNMFLGFPELDNIEIDNPPDFSLSDLQFGSQESIMSWLDRL